MKSISILAVLFMGLLVTPSLVFAQFEENIQISSSAESSASISVHQNVNIGSWNQGDEEFAKLEKDDCNVRFEGLSVINGLSYMGIIKQSQTNGEFTVTVKLKKLELPVGFTFPDQKLSVKFDGEARGNFTDGMWKVKLKLDKEGDIRTLEEEIFTFNNCTLAYAFSFDVEEFLDSLTPRFQELPPETRKKFEAFEEKRREYANKTNDSTEFTPELKAAIEAAAAAEAEANRSNALGYQVAKFFGLRAEEEVMIANEQAKAAATIKASASGMPVDQARLMNDISADLKAEADGRKRGARGIFSIFFSANA